MIYFYASDTVLLAIQPRYLNILHAYRGPGCISLYQLRGPVFARLDNFRYFVVRESLRILSAVDDAYRTVGADRGHALSQLSEHHNATENHHRLSFAQACVTSV